METIKSQLKIYHQPPLSNPILLAGWLTQDVGNVGAGVISQFRETRKVEEVAELDPLGFFAFEGAIFKNDLIQIPKSQFKASVKDNVLTFSSDEPMYERYQFLKIILDFCEEHFGLSQLYSFNGNPSLISHHHPRRIFVVFNREELRDEFFESDQVEHTSWEGPPEMSTYLLWLAQKKGIKGINLWVEVPFYLAALEDGRAIKTLLSLMESRYHWGVLTQELDDRINHQEKLLEELRETNSEVDEIMSKLEEEELLEENEQINLSKDVYKHLKKSD